MEKNIVRRITGIVLCAVLLWRPFAAKLAYAADPKFIAYEDAVKMSLKNLSGLLSVDATLKALKEQRDKIQDQLAALENDPMSMYGAYGTVLTLRETIKQLDKQTEQVKLNQDILKASTEISLRGILVNIAGYELDVQLLEESIRLNQENLRRVSLRHQYGMASANDLRAAEQTLDQHKANKETLLISLANERQALNKLLKQPLTQETVITYDNTLKALPENLESYITGHLKNAPTLKQKQITVDMKKNIMDNNHDSLQELTLKNDYEQAVRELDDAKRNLEAAIRTNYNNLGQLTQREQLLQIDLEKAQNTYKTVEANLKAGMVTQYDLDGVSLSILNTEIAIQKNQINYWHLQFAFANPFLLSN